MINMDDDETLHNILNKAKQQYNKDLSEGKINEPSNNLVLLGLSMNDIAILKEVFDDAKLKALFCRDDIQYRKYCDLYAAIYLQVKAEHLNF